MISNVCFWWKVFCLLAYMSFLFFAVCWAFYHAANNPMDYKGIKSVILAFSTLLVFHLMSNKLCNLIKGRLI